MADEDESFSDTFITVSASSHKASLPETNSCNLHAIKEEENKVLQFNEDERIENETSGTVEDAREKDNMIDGVSGAAAKAVSGEFKVSKESADCIQKRDPAVSLTTNMNNESMKDKVELKLPSISTSTATSTIIRKKSTSSLSSPTGVDGTYLIACDMFLASLLKLARVIIFTVI